jgi:hypothetical protein
MVGQFILGMDGSRNGRVSNSRSMIDTSTDWTRLLDYYSPPLYSTLNSSTLQIPCSSPLGGKGGGLEKFPEPCGFLVTSNLMAQYFHS